MDKIIMNTLICFSMRMTLLFCCLMAFLAMGFATAESISTTRLVNDTSREEDNQGKSKETIKSNKDNQGKLVPLAAGGIGLMIGLLAIFLIVAIFIRCSRNNHYVFEPPLLDDVENHI